MKQNYDIIIIGTGAGGGTLAYKLAPSGKKILIIERGEYIPREKENWDTNEVFVKGKYKTKEEWLDKKGKSFRPGTHYCVGGNTKFYGAALLRMRETDFGEVKHHAGISPAWPIIYEDLKPFYLEAENLYNVHGLRGSDPTEPKEENPYSGDPLPHEPRIQELFNDFKSYGLQPFPLPIGVNTGKHKLGSAPFVLDRFDGFPDPTESKADSHTLCIREALKHDNVELWINCHVKKLNTNKEGNTISEVIVEKENQEIKIKGNIVIVACGAINSAKLLLQSANKSHPNGLANSSGVVGRNYMCHNNSAMVALSKKVNHTKFGKTFAINDYYHKSNDFNFPLGHIQMLGKSDAIMFKDDAPGFASKKSLETMAEHALDFWMTSEDLPDPENRVTVVDGKVCLHYKENNIEGHKRLQKKLKKALEHLGCEKHIIPNHMYFGKKIPLGGVAHQCGTIRFGINPETSALNSWCRSHEVNNLYVVDGSFFPSSSAVNPALTIIAQALRVGDYLIKD